MDESKSQPHLQPAEAYDLVNMVQYATGSIVSRTLANNQAGTVTVFAFEAGQGLSEHSAPFDALIQILDGEATLVIGGKTLPVVSGQLVLMPANIPHAIRSGGAFKMMLIMLRAA